MTLKLNGAVVPDSDKELYDMLMVDCITPSQVKDSIANSEGNIEIELNSEGGSVFAGLEIFSALKEYAGNVTINITGLAASIATVIASAADKVNMSLGAQFMIHNPSSGTISGDHNDLKKTLNALTSIKDSLIAVYNDKTGIDEDELSAMMDQETWMTAKQAKSLGFVDNIIHTKNETFDNSMQFVNAVETIKKEGIDLKDKKSIVDQIKNLLNSAKEDDLVQEETVEEIVETPEVEEAAETTEETQEEVAEDNETETVIAEMTKSLEEAKSIIEELKEDNEKLKNQLEVSNKENAVTSERLTKAKNTLSSLNELINSKEDIFITDAAEEPKAKRGRFNHY